MARRTQVPPPTAIPAIAGLEGAPDAGAAAAAVVEEEAEAEEVEVKDSVRGVVVMARVVLEEAAADGDGGDMVEELMAELIEELADVAMEEPEEMIEEATPELLLDVAIGRVWIWEVDIDKMLEKAVSSTFGVNVDGTIVGKLVSKPVKIKVISRVLLEKPLFDALP